MTRLTHQSLRDGLEEVAGVDPDVGRALDAYGFPKLRRRARGFKSLMRAIVGQQVSIHAADAIWARLEALVEPFEADTFRALTDAELRGAGLSRQKIAYGRSLAELVASGEVKLHRLPGMPDEDAIAELTKIKGIGRWTAEIYLLFALGRRDIWPVDDLALMIAAQHVKGLRERPERKAMMEIGEAWRPWRGAVSHLLWHTYRAAELHRKPSARSSE